MPPLTLAILASLLHMQGADATITSDNKGIEDLLAAVRGQLQEQVNPNGPRIIQARHNKGTYYKAYFKGYDKTWKGYSKAVSERKAPKPGVGPGSNHSGTRRR